MYKHKYYKYKKKYINLKKQMLFINESNMNTNIDEEFVKEDIISESTEEHDNHPYNIIDLDFETPEDIESINILDSEYIEPDIKLPEYVGKYAPNNKIVKGTKMEEFEIDPEEIIHLNDVYIADKILKLDTNDDFDDFTEKYGLVITDNNDTDNNLQDDILAIDWVAVSEKYKGLYINKGLEDSRKDETIFKGNTYPSWWLNDFQFDNIVVFSKE